ncbi:c2h2 transcription factor swi5 protein [Rutstroemia sp. NJR-2017a BBW]|nr:c2h2 transcription factor swi5 protein [Rutstroemia sp. NJR-2017a BBW]
MLSNPTNNLQNRHRQHRRQNSTPTAFDAVKVNNLPTVQKHGHRRGMSLDTRRRPTSPQVHTHILRETQQQRLVRPGQQQFMTYDNDENQFIPSLVAPHRQSFDAGCTSSYGVMAPQHQHQHSYSFSGSMNAIMPVDPNFPGSNDFDFFAPNAAMTPTFMEFFAESGIQDANSQPGSANHSRRSSRSIGGVILDRVAQFENLALKSPERPLTPPNQDSSNYFPPTPLDSPFNRTIKQEHIPRRFREDYDTSMEETIKPKNNRRAKTVFDEMRQEAEMKAAPSPPGSGPMPSSSTFDSAPMPTSNFLNMSNMNLDFLKNDPQFPQPQYSPTSSNVSHDVSYPSSPEQSQAKSFRDSFTNRPILEATESSYSLPTYHNGLPISEPASSSPVQSAYRRSESVSSINLEESITDTGITIDDIATYIQAPDPGDTRWLCLPRKNRPDDEERITKSSRTRSKNKNISSTSSCSEYSESTSAHSPRSEIDLLDSKSFSDYEYSQSSSLNHGSLEYVRERSSSIAASSITDCVSPRAIQPVRVPITLSAQSSFSERLPSRAPSPSKSSQSNYSPPALCESSSSPATSNNIYDLDAVSNSGELSSLPNITEQDDMFLEAFAAAAASNGMSQLERDPDLLMGKFDSMFAAATENDEMFRSEEDVFFGSP